MKKIYDFGLAMLLIGFCTVGAMAQIACKDSIIVVLDNITGLGTLVIEDVVVGAIPAGATIDRSSVTCDDVGKDLSVTATNGTASCFSVITVLDKTPPVVVGDLNVEIRIPDGLTELVLNPVVFDDGSYDNCSSLTMRVEPEEITCADVGQEIPVVLYVQDDSGNENSVVSNVFVSGSITGNLVCTKDFEVAVVDNYQVTASYIHNGLPICSDISLLLSDADGNEIENGLIDTTFIGQAVTATITQVEDNTSCSTVITVVKLECERFYICDTACNNAPVGDCDSGHTEDDYGEWPCDITIPSGYPGFEGSSPEFLIANYDILEKDARPQLVEEECHEIGTGYEDDIFYIGNSVKVIRTWHILEWRTQDLFSYSQEILFEGGGSDLVWNICDTKANDTPLGECESGHTSSDDIEWPADVSAVDHRAKPSELINISKVPAQNARPIIFANEDYYRISYADAVISSTASFSLVARVWTVQSTQSGSLNAEYRQNITIPEIANAAEKVYVTTHGGRPMPGVSVNDLYTTDGQGTAIMQGEDFVALSYEDDPLAGLDVLDEVLMYKHILGQVDISDLPYPAMDINLDGNISTLDVVLLRKLNLEEANPEDFNLGWKFYQRTEPFTNVKGDYVSFKVGDVDDSAPLLNTDSSEPSEKIVIEDQLLNAGEVYSVNVDFTEVHDLFAGQFFFDLDLDLVKVEDVAVGAFEDYFSWQVKESGLLSVYLRDKENKVLDLEENLFTISLKALKNSTMYEALGLSETTESFLVDNTLSKLSVGFEVARQITSRIPEIAKTVELKVIPNPTTDQITVLIDSEREVYMEISNAQGQKVGTSNQTSLDVRDYPKGIYFIQGTNGKINFTSKFVKL